MPAFHLDLILFFLFFCFQIMSSLIYHFKYVIQLLDPLVLCHVQTFSAWLLSSESPGLLKKNHLRFHFDLLKLNHLQILISDEIELRHLSWNLISKPIKNVFLLSVFAGLWREICSCLWDRWVWEICGSRSELPEPKEQAWGSKFCVVWEREISNPHVP